MDRIKLIYNPAAGGGTFGNYLGGIQNFLIEKGIPTDMFIANSASDFCEQINQTDQAVYTEIVVAGGDGSLNLAVNAILRAGLDIPLGIIPTGTANDFATYLGMPMDLKSTAEVLCKMKIRQIDVGQVNGQYFINVCGGGIFTDISYRIDRNKKRLLGKAAYYFQGLMDLPKLSGIKLRISAPDANVDITDDFYLFLVCNGSNIGGFSNIVSGAEADDGLLDFVALKVFPPTQIPVVAAKILAGDHLKDDRFVHFQASHMVIERLDNNITNLDTDVDGEKGPDYPLTISVLPSRLKILSPW